MTTTKWFFCRSKTSAKKIAVQIRNKGAKAQVRKADRFDKQIKRGTKYTVERY